MKSNYETVDYDPTLVQQKPTAPESEQDVGRFVANRLTKMNLLGVAKDHKSRIIFGEKKYGQRLRTNNGRDAWNDTVQELLDGCSYGGQLQLEGRDNGDLFRIISYVTAIAELRWKGYLDGYQEYELWDLLLEAVREIYKRTKKDSQCISINP